MAIGKTSSRPGPRPCTPTRQVRLTIAAGKKQSPHISVDKAASGGRDSMPTRTGETVTKIEGGAGAEFNFIVSAAWLRAVCPAQLSSRSPSRPHPSRPLLPFGAG